MSKSVEDDPHFISGWDQFGLTSMTLDDAEIHWPSALVEILKHLSADKFYIVEDGTRIVSRQGMVGKPSRITGTEIQRVQ